MRNTDTLPEPLSSVLKEAILECATDIHIDSAPSGEIVRFRIDGILHRKDIVDAEQAGRLVNQVKVAADLNTDRTFLPLESDIDLQRNVVVPAEFMRYLRFAR